MTHKTKKTFQDLDRILPLFRKNWDPVAGLWQLPGPGHTPDTLDLPVHHPSRDSAWMLVSAGLDGVLDRLETGRVLRNLRAMQEPDGPKRGCFRWSWEDRTITDSNGGFFTGLALIVLYFEFGKHLTADDRALLRIMLAELRFWFDSELADLGPQKLRYPNKCLGDVVCGWLLAEIDDAVTPELEATMKTAADYYRDQNWGWGEHLSDIYATVCNYELTALLLYATALPPPLRGDYERLFTDLLTLDALFAGGPRVPAIRSYSLTQSPQSPREDPAVRRPFLETLEPWSPAMPRRLFSPLRSLAHARNFQSLYAVHPARTERVDVPCFNGATALVRITDFFRMGAMTRYPMMPDTEHAEWGLCWQSMPVCYWNRNGDWGFLQWETRENGVAHAHPAFTRHHRMHVQITETVVPPLVGETYGARVGGQFLVLRRMPGLAPGWTELKDRFRLIASSAATAFVGREGLWHSLTLEYPAAAERPRHLLRLLFHPLSTGARMSLLRPAPGRMDWDVSYPLEPDARSSSRAGVWLWQAGGALPPAPLVVAEGRVVVVSFASDPSPVSFRIEPEAKEPRWESV